MKTKLTIYLIAFAIFSCKKTDPVSNDDSAVFITEISANDSPKKETFEYNNGNLTHYTFDLFGNGGIEYNIVYDSQNRPSSVFKNNQEYAALHYSGNKISIIVNHGFLDSLVYTLNGTGKIMSVEKFDNFSGTMLRNASLDYFYSHFNLMKIEGLEYNHNGTIKHRYTEEAEFDENNNALKSSYGNAALRELLFALDPKRVFVIHSKNNLTKLSSNHTSDGFDLIQNIQYNSSHYPISISHQLNQYGLFESETERYEYE